MNKKKRFWVIVVFFALSGCGVVHSMELEFSTRENTLEWFESARFGIFLHVDARADLPPDDGTFNVDVRPSMKRAHEVAVWGDERNPPRIKPWQDWNPEKFDAEQWVDLFLEAGAKYGTFITMHMWCLSNFDHPATTFDIMSTPYGKDCAAQLARAANGKLPLMWYYNMYPEKHVQKDREKHFNQFLDPDVHGWEEFRKIGIHELVRNLETYGKVAGIWCDGGGTFSNKPVNDDFYTAMRDVQPWLIFSPRCGHPDVPKDWRVPEQKMAPINWRIPQEMTMPIESDQWFWARGKMANTKDVAYCIQILTQTATRDANLLLNLSPKGDGSIDPYQASILRGIGIWLRRYGESIFGTRGGPYTPGIWGGSTRKGRRMAFLRTQLWRPPGRRSFRAALAQNTGHYRRRTARTALQWQGGHGFPWIQCPIRWCF
jgi:alpha-L-fucosidase